MGRYINGVTNVVVNVPDEKGKRLGPEWSPVKPEPKTRTKKTDQKSEE